MKELFVVVGKLPSPGFSKTRLAFDLGEKLSLKFSHAFIDDFFCTLGKSRYSNKLLLFITPVTKESTKYYQVKNEIHLAGLANLAYQPTGDLMARLNFLMGHHSDSSEDFIHITGTDIPDFPFSYLDEVDTKKEEVTIGPDLDGGFYYLGAKAKYKTLFEGLIAGDTLLEQMLKTLKSLGIDYKLLPVWSDIDNKEDLFRTIGRSKTLLPKTYSLFKEHFE